MQECRICNCLDFNEILTLEGVPKAAQYFISDLTQDSLSRVNLNVIQCNNCGLVQLDTKPVEYYKSVISAASLSTELWKNRKKIIGLLAEQLDLKKPSIIEIGAGQGSNISKIVHDLDYPCLGVEYSHESVLIGKTNNLPLLEGYICDVVTEASIPNSTFDIALIFNFIEHMPDPVKAIRNIRKKLRSKSRLYATVPSLSFITRTNCLHEFVIDHLSYFTPETLSYLLAVSGYDVISVKHINNDNDLEIIASPKTNETPALDFNLFYKLIGLLNQAFINAKTRGHKVYIWGAGHRSLTLISQLQYGLIDYIVDSAPFKQGLYSPATLLPIVSPSFLRKDASNKSLFLSLPGIYNQEVIKIISENPLERTDIYSINELGLVRI